MSLPPPTRVQSIPSTSPLETLKIANLRIHHSLYWCTIHENDTGEHIQTRNSDESIPLIVKCTVGVGGQATGGD